MLGALHLPAVCKVKTTAVIYFVTLNVLHLPAVCKVKTTCWVTQKIICGCICLLFAR